VGGDRTANFVGLVSFSSQGPGRKPGASLYTRKRFSLSLVFLGLAKQSPINNNIQVSG